MLASLLESLLGSEGSRTGSHLVEGRELWKNLGDLEGGL